MTATPKDRADALRQQLLNEIKEAADIAAKEHSMSLIRQDSGAKPIEAAIDFKRMLTTMAGVMNNPNR